MRRTLVHAAASVFATLAALGAIGPTGTALAADGGANAGSGTATRAAPNIPIPPHTQFRAVNRQFQGFHTGDWVICAHFVNRSSKTAHANCSRTVSTSTSFSLTGGYSPSDVSQSVGFNISVGYTWSTQFGLTVDMPPHTQAFIAFGIDYNQWRDGMERRQCVGSVCGPWSGPSSVTVQHALEPAIGAFDRRPV